MCKCDRELLELAAKAAGYDTKSDGEGGLTITVRRGVCRNWDPLTDDGDALRLASDLELEVSFGQYGAIIYMKGGIKIEEISEDYRPAIRKAIVRAAAAIGETLP